MNLYELLKLYYIKLKFELCPEKSAIFLLNLSFKCLKNLNIH